MSDPGTLITSSPTVINTTSRLGEPTSASVIISSASDPISTTGFFSSPGVPTSTIISSSSTIYNTNLAATPPSTSTFLSTSILPPISSTSDYLSPTPAILPSYQSISAISLTIISTDEITITPSPSTWAPSQTTVTISVVETAVLSSDTPQHAEFTRQTGAIIGIAIGGAFLLLLIILLLFLAYRYRSNRSYNSPIFAISRSASWHSPLADDDDHYLAPHGPSTHDDGRFSGDRLSVEDNGSAESAGATGGPLMTAFGGHPPLPPLAQILHNSRGPSVSPNYPSDHGNLRPWWANTQPLNVNKRVDSHVSARSTGSSGETPLLGGKTRGYSITEPRPVHKPSGHKNYLAPPTGFALGRDSSLEYATQRIQEHQEKEIQQDRADQTISQIILARLRRQSTTTTVQSKSEESGSSRTRSHIYSPSLLNPPMIIPEFYQGPTGSTPGNQHSGGESEKPFSPGVTLPPIPSLLSTDASSMVEGLLHPRLGALAQSPQRASASSMSLRDHEDYTRPINGLVNNHIQSTTTLELGEGGTQNNS